MISQLSNTGPLLNAYNSSAKKDGMKSAITQVSQQGDTSRIEQLKASISDGSYQIDLRKLSEKLADDLI